MNAGHLDFSSYPQASSKGTECGWHINIQQPKQLLSCQIWRKCAPYGVQSYGGKWLGICMCLRWHECDKGARYKPYPELNMLHHSSDGCEMNTGKWLTGIQLQETDTKTDRHLFGSKSDSIIYFKMLSPRWALTLCANTKALNPGYI